MRKKTRKKVADEHTDFIEICRRIAGEADKRMKKKQQCMICHLPIAGEPECYDEKGNTIHAYHILKQWKQIDYDLRQAGLIK